MEFKKILVAIDQESQSRSPVFDRALVEAEKHHAQLVVFSSFPQDTLAEVEGRVGALTEMEQQDALLKRNKLRQLELDHLKAWLEDLCNQATQRGVQARAAAEIGQAGRQIVDLAGRWGADLIVLGRTQRGSLADCLFGTVSDYVIHHARCSLLLVQ